MINAFEKIRSAVDMEKLAYEGAGVTLFENIEEMASEFDMTIEEIQEKTSGVFPYTRNFDVTTLDKQFIVYDFNVAEFEFLTDTSESSINNMIERINNP